MISNEKQYNISRKRIEMVKARINEIQKDTRQDPLAIEMSLASMKNHLSEVQEEVVQYERLKKRKKVTIKERPLSQLPQLITEFKIASGLTQKELSKKLGMKEQQLQRYEANRFKGISFDNLLQLISAMDIELVVKPKSAVRRKRTK